MRNLEVLVTVFITSAVLGCKADSNSCSWSNEDCSDDKDCCSHSCHKAHEGTNPRCRHSALGEPCVFDYHCQDSLTCGDHYNCCSPYWKMCNKDADCCDKVNHVCRSADGFYYLRCLWRSGASRPSPTWSSLFILYLPLVSLSVLQRFMIPLPEVAQGGSYMAAITLSIFVFTSLKCVAAYGAVG